jgi:hypothetical protein
MLFKVMVEYYDKLRGVSSRNSKVGVIKDLLGDLS